MCCSAQSAAQLSATPTALQSTGYDLLINNTVNFKSPAQFSAVESAAHQSAALLLISLLLISQNKSAVLRQNVASHNVYVT